MGGLFQFEGKFAARPSFSAQENFFAVNTHPGLKSNSSLDLHYAYAEFVFDMVISSVAQLSAGVKQN